MDKILDFYENSGEGVSLGRIDGTYVGPYETLIDKLILVAKDSWKIFILGEIVENSIIKEYEGKNNKYKYYCEIKEDEKEYILDILKKSYIEVVYLFDENYNLKIIVDDFPEDISINIDLFH